MLIATVNFLHAVYNISWLSCAESQATMLTAVVVVNPERAVFTH